MTCAFKCFKTRNLMATQDKFDEFEREVSILSSLFHPNIIRFFGATMKTPRVGIVMEFASNGEILDYILKFRERGGSAYPLFQKLRMLYQIASSLSFLHSRNIIHRDLKPENVLIDEKENCKLMDFGLSRLVESMSVDKTVKIGTSFYMAPEIMSDVKYTEKCDVFSFSILFFVVLTENQNPYDVDLHVNSMIEMKVANDSSFRPNVKKLEFLKEEGEEVHGWILELIKNCWDHDPVERKGFEEICDILEKGYNDTKKEGTQRIVSVDVVKQELVDTVPLQEKSKQRFVSYSKEDLIGLILELENSK